MITIESAIIYFLEAMWFILPAYFANGFAPVFKGKVPIDGGRKMRDGRRIFGDGKTVRGFLGGCFTATVIGFVQMLAFPFIPMAFDGIALSLIAMNPGIGFLLGFGALTGDAAGSFVKRRLDIGRGRPAPLLDQYDFIAGALFFTFIVVSIKSQWVVALLIVTPIFHLIANAAGYLMKIKNEPY